MSNVRGPHSHIIYAYRRIDHHVYNRDGIYKLYFDDFRFEFIKNILILVASNQIFQYMDRVHESRAIAPLKELHVSLTTSDEANQFFYRIFIESLKKFFISH